MRIQVLSDIHVEFHRDGGRQLVDKYLKPENADVLILAGDLATSGLPLFASIKSVCRVYKDSQILYVPGNHEFYGTSIDSLLPVLKQLEKAHSNLRVMYNDAMQIGKFLFVGTTLWFPTNDRYKDYRPYLSDFSHIRGFEEVVFEHNKEAQKFLRWHVSNESMVITHHAPSVKSIPDRFKTSSLNMFFVSDMEKLILSRKPKMWVHGHTHDSFNYMLGDTHVICNPLGYVGREVNPLFIPNLVVDTDV